MRGPSRWSHRWMAWLPAGLLLLLGLPSSGQAQEAPNAKAAETSKQPAKDEPVEAPGLCPSPEEVQQNLIRPDLSIDKYHPGPLPPPPPDCCCHFFLDGGFWMTQPYFSHNPGFTYLRPQGSGTQEFGYAVDFSPRVQLGAVTPSGWGFRLGWWYYNESNNTPFLSNHDATLRTTILSPPIAGVPGFTSPGPVARSLGVFNDTFDFTDHLRLDVYDVEATWECRSECWSLLTAAGMRYAFLSQRYDTYRFNKGTGRTSTATDNLREDSDTLTSGHDFTGAGLTGALELHRRLGGCGFGLYATARGSELFGHERMQAFQREVENAQITPTGGRAQTISTAKLFQSTDGHNTSLPLSDFEGGVEWSQQCRLVRLFLQAGVVSETWFGAGTATSGQGDLTFFGMRFTAGITY